MFNNIQNTFQNTIYYLIWIIFALIKYIARFFCNLKTANEIQNIAKEKYLFTY